jgi:hypothetical protein
VKFLHHRGNFRDLPRGGAGGLAFLSLQRVGAPRSSIHAIALRELSCSAFDPQLSTVNFPKSFRIRTFKLLDLKPFRIRTYEKEVGDGAYG